MISDALTMPAAPPQAGDGGSIPPELPAELQALFLPFLQQAAAPPGADPPKANGARTAQSEGADSDTDTDSAEPVAASTAPADPIAAALLQVSLPVPTSGAPTHTDDAQEQGAGAHDARTAPSGPARPIADARVEMPQLPQEAAVDAARPAADPVAWTAAQATHAAAQTGGTAAAGPVELGSAGARGATDPAAPPVPAAAKKAFVHRHAPVDAIRSAVQEAARAVAQPAPLGAAVDAPAAPTAAPLTGHAATPTAHSRLGELPETAATLLQVAASAKATHARIVLTPPELGKVEIRLRYGANGVSATFHADAPEAAQSLAGAAGDLRRTLEQQGIQVARIDVPATATAPGADQQGSPWLGGGDANPGSGRGRHGGDNAPANPSLMTFETDDQTTLRTVLLGTAVDVLA